VFSRTGGGGDKPLIDRGVHDASGMSAPGTGYAREFALAGLAGISVDGPHGGPRNPTGGDEQFLVYNVQNPLALRDNIRQSALELSLTAHLAGELSLDASACPGLGAVTFDPTRLAAFGHSMGAVVVPIAAASEPLFGAVALSGAGSSFIENILHKQSPIATKAFAELLLGYVGAGMELDRFDPVLSLLQWAGEASDPPVYGERMRAAGVGPHAFVVQGIVDTYILPPIASATNLSFGITQGGEALDASAPGLEAFRPLGGLLPLAGLTPASLPATAQGSALRVVVQHAEDGLEDGHEIAYQSSDARAQVACFLATYASGGAPTAVAKGGACP